MPPNDSECDCLLNSLLGRKHTFDHHHHHRHPTHSQALAASSHHSQQCHHPTNPPGPTTLCVSTSSADFGGQSTYYSAAAFYIMYMHTYIHMYVCTSFSTHTPGHPAHSTQRCNNVILSWHNSQCKHQHYQSGIYSLSILLSGRSVGWSSTCATID